MVPIILTPFKCPLVVDNVIEETIFLQKVWTYTRASGIAEGGKYHKYVRKSDGMEYTSKKLAVTGGFKVN